MKMSHISRARIPFLLGFLSVFLFSCPAGAEDEEVFIVENEWNYVDNSLDVTNGIPEDAVGRLLAIQESGRLTVATEPYYAPQEFIDPSLSGQESYVGADMELARLIAKRMGVELEIVPLEFDDVLASVARGQYDLAISGLAFTPSRAQNLEFSKGYHYGDSDSATDGLLIREKDVDKIKSPEDLKNRTIVAQSLSLQESLAVDNLPYYHEFRRLTSILDIYQAVENESADAALVNIENAQVYIDNNPECGLMLAPGLTFSLDEQYTGDRIAAPKGEVMLIGFVNGVIDEVMESGQYEEWFEKYAARAGELRL